jgi:hypothetical protein
VHEEGKVELQLNGDGQNNFIVMKEKVDFQAQKAENHVLPHIWIIDLKQMQ